jgi:uncharacterized protein YndB with AHSA1/START domain
MTSVADTSVKKSVTVNASVEHAFAVFTAEFDTWWPRSHHIGKSPMKQAIIETRAGGRCYTTQEDGTECDWGRILEWDPPHRFLLAWHDRPTLGFNVAASVPRFFGFHFFELLALLRVPVKLCDTNRSQALGDSICSDLLSYRLGRTGGHPATPVEADNDGCHNAG